MPTKVQYSNYTVKKLSDTIGAVVSAQSSFYPIPIYGVISETILEMSIRVFTNMMYEICEQTAS